MKQRIRYIDLAKTASIWLVLWGHAMTQLMPSHDLDHNSAFVWLYSFHMPLFMLMSGLFAQRSLQLPLCDLLWTKFRQLIVPALLFGVVWYVISWCFDPDNGITLSAFAKHEVTCYWFLKSLFLCFVVGWCIVRSRPKWLATVAFLAFFWMLQRWNITCFKLGQMLPFFLLGWFVREHLVFLARNKFAIFGVCMIVHSGLLLFGCYTQELSFPTYFFAHPSVLVAMRNYAIFFVTAMSGSGVLLAGCCIVEGLLKEGHVRTFLLQIGQLTLWIYLWQKLLLEIILPQFLTVEQPIWCFNYLFTPLVAISMLWVCCWFSKWTKNYWPL